MKLEHRRPRRPRLTMQEEERSSLYKTFKHYQDKIKGQCKKRNVLHCIKLSSITKIKLRKMCQEVVIAVTVFVGFHFRGFTIEMVDFAETPQILP